MRWKEDNDLSAKCIENGSITKLGPGTSTENETQAGKDQPLHKASDNKHNE